MLSYTFYKIILNNLVDRLNRKLAGTNTGS